jgi:hypothetical protein
MDAIVIAVTVGLLATIRFFRMHRTARALASQAMAQGAEFEAEFGLWSGSVRIGPSPSTERSAETHEST